MAMYPCLLKPRLTFPTLTGSIVTFNSQYAGLPLKSHTIALTATQSGSGTPSPDNIRSINGHSSIHIQNTCGINQWDEEWENGYFYESKGQLIYSTNTTTIRSKNYIPVTPSTNYYAVNNITADGYLYRIAFFDSNKNYISPLAGAKTAFTTPANAYFMKFFIQDASSYTSGVSINYPATDTSYHAFEGQSFTIQIGSTVYGGEYDARTGVLTVTHGVIDLGTLNWERRSNADYYYFRNTTNITNIKGGVAYQVGDIRCSIYETVQSAFSAGFVNYKMFLWTDGKIYLRNDDYTDANDFKTAMSGINLVYELATPTTIQLPPCPIDTLEGVNNIWADTGDTTLQYPKFG